MTVQFGIGLNSARPSSTDNTRFEMLGPGPKDVVNMPLSTDNITVGTGAQGVSGGVYPAKLDDGYFFTLTSAVASNSVTGGDYGVDATAGGPFRPTRGTEFFDYAADATGGPVYMYYGAQNAVISGDENRPFLDYPTNTVANPDYEPGAYHSEAITGYQGLVDAWVPLRCVQEANFSGYVVGAKVTVQKGRLKLAATGDPVVGIVERKFSTTKVKIKYNIVAVLPIMA